MAVFDLDGTLADTRHRLHHIEGSPKRWEDFFRAAVHDAPLEEGVALLRELAERCEIAYVTGRPERWRGDSVEWLERHGLPRGRLWMRADRDRRPARATKLELVKRLAARRAVEVVVDDDELVCDACERAGFAAIRARWMPEAPVLRQAQEGEGRT